MNRLERLVYLVQRLRASCHIKDKRIDDMQQNVDALKATVVEQSKTIRRLKDENARLLSKPKKSLKK